MNNFLGTQELLAQLDALKNVAQDFAAREEKLETTFRSQTNREASTFETSSRQLTNAAAVQAATLENNFTASKNELAAWFSRRAARINRAHHQIRERAAARIEAQDADCKARAQQGLLAAEKQHDEELAGVTNNFEQFQIRQAAAAADLEALELSVRSAFGGCGKFRRRLNLAATPEAGNFSGDGYEMLDAAGKLSEKITLDLQRFKKKLIPQLFRFVPVWLVILLLAGIAIPVSVLPNLGHFIPLPVAYVALGLLGALVVIYLFGTRTADPLAKEIAADFVRAKHLVNAAPAQAAGWQQAEQTRIENEFAESKNLINQEWRRETREITQLRNARPVDLEQRIAELEQRNGIFYQTELKRRQSEHENNLARLQAESASKLEISTTAKNQRVARWEAEFQNGWRELEAGWRESALPILENILATSAAAEKAFPEWLPENSAAWQPPQHFLNAAKFARLEIDSGKFFTALPRDARLALPCPAQMSLPLLLTHPQQGSLLLETNKQGDAEAVAAMNNIILRLLATTPPGRVEFTIFDPVGLGQNFATLMHLADYEAGAINSRIWTQSAQFEEKLAALNEHMEKIIQMYLRNEYATIAEYNAEAGSVAEKYHVLVIASFPVNFSDLAAKRLRNIAASGARCGVFTLVHWDHRNAAPSDFVPDELRQNSVNLIRGSTGFEFARWRPPGVKVILDTPPSAEFATQFLQHIGELGRNSNRVEVPFETVAPSEAEMWSEETSEILRVPIGRSGATKFQYLEIGSGTRQHALIAGKTGSGKSTLFHVIITNLALRCSPEQVEFYLVDFKKGVEFKCYGSHRLPHARVVAIESDREFGLSVLQRVDDELRRRGDLFRQVGAQNLAGYKRAGGTEPVPRSLLMIDEFQEFFTEEDRVSQGAAVLLDRIVRQGRAFGIHVILGSQTLGGAYTLARATIGQMVIRIALQCNEADAYLIMDQDNPAPRLLSRPGEGIYNDTAGSIEGNAPFQAVWIDDRVRDEQLEKIRRRADAAPDKFGGPIVFEGNAPADVRENRLLNSLRWDARGENTNSARIWLGAPNSIKGPTEAVFQRQSASNLLVVGQSDERNATLLAISLVALAAQFSAAGAMFYVLDNQPGGSADRNALVNATKSVRQKFVAAGNAGIVSVMNALAEELKQRGDAESGGPEIFILIHGLQNFKKLRQEDDFSFSTSNDNPAASAAATLMSLITEGPGRGIHLIITCDTYNNVSRFLGRKALGEFEMRVVFQMSASDSAGLIDSPIASNLGLHRAVFYHDREGFLETFRPYAQPDQAWFNSPE